LNKKESDTKLSPLLLPECEKDDEGTTMQSRNVDDEMESRQGDPTLMEMIRIRTEITAKKLVKETFDFIVGKGKILLNQGVYQRSKEEYLGEVSKFLKIEMEVILENILEELNRLTSKIAETEQSDLAKDLRLSHEFETLARVKEL